MPISTKLPSDRSGTDVGLLDEQWDDKPSGELGDKAFMQGGIGIYTRIEFPSLGTLLLKERKFVLTKAELIFKTTEREL